MNIFGSQISSDPTATAWTPFHTSRLEGRRPVAHPRFAGLSLSAIAIDDGILQLALNSMINGPVGLRAGEDDPSFADSKLPELNC
ncbi:hypothetical protein PCANC_09268 [Puccinia coronata f. sp. avenae]|uniref:Uncharacterized protein n=1 Tax=Puccinia coronata f. sp. avenae TaxID=200324 RepID=A0A2N5T2X4_9BASI|nr:hypothetical protein PCANC_09268 [Puccinia coronata f. sp. avenae]